ncbi:MAG: Stp1/IreP family PP2C-type Ser/Thr phosphatase [Mariprofundaceae bacterium]|nr:Stp1/IreP family PP2C-type Ser/Thr phosphatase [Mariprofundaceae bacterium]
MSALEMIAVTDVGVKRSHNEDCVGIDLASGIAVLADGMGGHNAGEVASAMAVDLIKRLLKDGLTRFPQGELDEETGFSREAVLARDSAVLANNTIIETAQSKPECAGMGTTVVVAVFFGDRIAVSHVGDSRMYLLRKEVLSHVTEDHSLIQEQVRRGLLTAEDARNSAIKNLVTRALGVEMDVEADVVEDITLVGDTYMMCSDGLTDVVPDEAIRLTMLEHSNNLEKAAQCLIDLANDAGGPDNISVIIMRVKNEFTRKKGFLTRLFGGK